MVKKLSPKRIINLIPKIEKHLPKALDIIENENIKKITNKPTNIKELLDELRLNIKSENHWATFYLIQIFSERVADFIIVNENDFFREKKIPNSSKKGYFTIKEKIEDNFYFYNKILCLKELSKSSCRTTKDFETLIDILELLRFIRNKYMFHVTNYDEYSFIHQKKDMYKKEECFINNVSKLVEKLKLLMNDFNKNSYEWQLLERYSSHFESSINDYTRLIEISKKSNGQRTINNVGVNEVMPDLLSRVSYIFILFLGKNDLSLLK